jgi:hypothetical protein
VPPETIARFDAGEPLSPNEASMVKGLLEVPNRILGRIPRLDAVRETIRYSSKHFDGTGQPDGPGGEHIPWGSRVLCLLRDLSQLETRGKSAEEAVEILSQRQGRYDPSLLDDLRVYVGSDGAEHNLREVSLAELRVGHRFVEPVLAQNGVLLVARGQTATDDLITRLENFSRSVGIREPLTVAVPVRTPATGTDG